ncbi:MAG: tripartite tricarboxylate transporter TctB family protein [Sulfitobacter sp.]
MQQNPVRQQNSDLWIGTIGVVVAICALLLVPVEVASDGWLQFANGRSAAFFPLWASGLLLLLSAAMLYRSRQHIGESGPARAKISYRVIGAALAFAVSGVALFWLGFLLTTGALIVALCLLFGERRKIPILSLALFVPLAIHGLFGGLLNVLLPSGIF